MLPKFSSLFSKKEPAGKAEASPSVPATPPPPAQTAPQRPTTPGTSPIPRPGQMGVTRVLPTPVPVGLRAPLRAPLPSPAPLDPARNKKRITQRITVNVPPSTVSEANAAPGKLVIPGAKTFSEFQPQSSSIAGSVQVPLHLILKSLPPQILAPEAQNFLDHPDSGATVPVPLGQVLSMLPSGKLEFAIRDFLPLLPGSAIRPMDASANELQMVFSLPLPEIFKLIPPEYISKRRDQKPIDPRIMSMADPFSEDELRKKAAEAAAHAIDTPLPTPSEPDLIPPPLTVPTPMSSVIPEVAKIEKEEVALPVPVESDSLASSEEDAGTSESAEVAEVPTSPVVSEPPISEEAEGPASVDLMALLAKANKEVGTDEVVAETPIPEVSTSSSEPLNEEKVEPVVSENSEEKPSDFAAALRQLDVEEKSAEPESLKEEEISQISETGTTTQEESESLPVEEAPTLTTPEPEPEIQIEERKIVESLPAPISELTRSISSAVDINQCSVEDLMEIGCPEGISRKILAWRELHGPFSDIRRIRRIPGMTDEIYRNVIGLPDPNSPINRELNEAFGLSANESLTVKDVAARIRRWPYMVACVIGGMEGLPIAFDGEDAKYADLISAFVPRLFQQTNTILEEVEESQTQEIHLVKDGRSLSIYCCGHLFLVTVNLRKDVSGRESDLIREIVTRLAELKESKLKA